MTGVLALVCFALIRNPPDPTPTRAEVADPDRDTEPETERHGQEEPGTTSAGEGKPSAASAVNPYRSDSFLWRIHAVSALLVVPQFAFSTYGLVWLIVVQGIGAGAAGAIVAIAQIVGAVGRMVVGALSDRTGSRVGLMRIVAVAAVIVVVAIAILSLTELPAVAAVVFILASAVSVADNGLAFASVAEAAGPRWSGKALGTQNTGQFVMSALLGPGFGALVTAFGYPLSFGLIALAPLLSVGIIPRRDVDRIT